MSPRKNKKQSEIDHALRRAAERFGLRLHQDLYLRLIRSIQDHTAEFVDRQSNRVTRWIVDVDGTKMCAAYDSNRSVIVSFITLEMLREGQKGDQDVYLPR